MKRNDVKRPEPRLHGDSTTTVALDLHTSCMAASHDPARKAKPPSRPDFECRELRDLFDRCMAQTDRGEFI